MHYLLSGCSAHGGSDVSLMILLLLAAVVADADVDVPFIQLSRRPTAETDGEAGQRQAASDVHCSSCWFQFRRLAKVR